MSEFVTPRFRRAIDYLLALEGGYVFHASDRGGETNFGISKRSYPLLNIRALTRDDAVQIYHRDFWTPLHCDELPSDRLAEAVFSMGVNAGVAIAARLLQRAIRALEKPVAPDGRIGPVTLAAAASCDPAVLLAAFLTECAKHYDRIAERDPSQRVFLAGWKNRLRVHGVDHD